MGCADTVGERLGVSVGNVLGTLLGKADKEGASLGIDVGILETVGPLVSTPSPRKMGSSVALP